ncbi:MULTISPECIES: nuclear transport factor 2 family protein [Croceitalea]|uniref:Nuclear transport factor 2 family protein n=1 Tax=Croceitalea vernalis TaxID=3075599 RepID=A0ABU3BF76_9FLAO|nr:MULTISPECIES: nuclear transport factor 2 family protein [unclassified Croceitalea]MDT0538996.1 nuclear transport factor 2 family protein [Croceitalea sp. P059]MDT0620783.1 nuclear transport factor 2 family protein [Croceitalea sp. P007]
MKIRVALVVLIFTSVFGMGQKSEKIKVNEVIDAWHKAASEANFDAYFGLMTKNGAFIGTDATENWQTQEFKDFSKPYFDKGSAWSFTSLERNVYLNENASFAWFDELLDTQMKLCRGSGVLEKVDGNWKIAHYVLSIAVPNKNVKELIEIKKVSDSLLIEKMSTN